ncbi:MAG: galactose mutarotase [Clostridia bacterium]|nr:galactose mutarotase [Clostridia bacterium]
MNKELFGYINGKTPVYKYEICDGDVRVCALDYGCTVNNFYYRGTDIVCGFDTIEDLLADNSYQGAVVGRYANRIKDAKFTLNGIEYQLAKNNGKNHLHGGKVGFDKRVWEVVKHTENELVFHYFSPDGEENYPANLDVWVTYKIAENALVIGYKAIADGDTVINLTNHAYFNADGYNAGSIYEHTAMICADYVTEVGDDLIPTGKDLSVTGTVFDLRAPTPIGKYIGKDFVGYDNNFILKLANPVDIAGVSLPFAAQICGRKNKISVYTDQPCMQLYIGNALDGTAPDFKGGYKRVKHTTYCLETQCAPDSPNYGKGILRKGEEYNKTTVFKIEAV